MSTPSLVSPILMLETSTPAMEVGSFDGRNGIIVVENDVECGWRVTSVSSGCGRFGGCECSFFKESRQRLANPFGEAILSVKASEKLYLGRLSIG